MHFGSERQFCNYQFSGDIYLVTNFVNRGNVLSSSYPSSDSNLQDTKQMN